MWIMRTIVIAIGLVCLVGAGPVLPASAQAQTEAAAALDALFVRLKAASERSSAREIEYDIWRAWLKSGDKALDAMMLDAREKMAIGRLNEALSVLDRLVAKAPKFAEAWNKRATVLYMVGRYDASLADIERVLALEPRHFGAISGIALIMLQKGDKPAALAAVKQGLAIHPFLPGADRIIEAAGGEGDPI